MSKTESHSGHHHITPLKVYLGVGVALIILTGVTVAVAQVDLGGWNAIVAVLIASIKASLVAFVFMHLWYDKKIYFVIFSMAVVFLTIFISLTMFDIASRGDMDEMLGQPIEKEAKMYEKLKSDTTGTAHDDKSKTEDSGH